MYEELDGLLSENEKKVYLVLLQLGESTASPILQKTGLQNSVFYRTIHRLMEKGYVSYILKGKIKHFKANKPELLHAHIKQTEEKIKSIIPKLKELEKKSEVKIDAEVFVGVKGVLAMYYSLIEDAKPEEEYYFFGPIKEDFFTAMEKVYLPFRLYRKEKKVKVFGITPLELKKVIPPLSEVHERYTDSPLPQNMAIFRDKIVIASWGETPTGILITGKNIAEQYKQLFWQMWKIAKK